MKPQEYSCYRFREITKMITAGKGAKRKILEDIKKLERHVKNQEKKIAEQSGRFPVVRDNEEE